MRTSVGVHQAGVTYGDSCHSSSSMGELPVWDTSDLSWMSAGRLFFLALGSGGSHSGRLFFLLSCRLRWACWWEQCCLGETSSRRVWLSPATVCDTNDILPNTSIYRKIILDTQSVCSVIIICLSFKTPLLTHSTIIYNHVKSRDNKIDFFYLWPTLKNLVQYYNVNELWRNTQRKRHELLATWKYFWNLITTNLWESSLGTSKRFILRHINTRITDLP